MKRSAVVLGIMLVLCVLPGLARAHGAPGAPAHRHWNGYTFYVTGSEYVPAPFDDEWGEFVPVCAKPKVARKASRTHRPKVYLEED